MEVETIIYRFSANEHGKMEFSDSLDRRVLASGQLRQSLGEVKRYNRKMNNYPKGNQACPRHSHLFLADFSKHGDRCAALWRFPVDSLPFHSIESNYLPFLKPLSD